MSGTGSMTGVSGRPYSSRFFDGQSQGSRRSADAVVPIVLELLSPSSVVDVGCGVGTWLASFRANGVDVLGIDGDYVDRSRLQIPPEQFLARDLTHPLALDRTFDLAVSLEVAEHLPDRVADTFVGSLTRLAPVVLFSAAIPGQGGTNHINEQWPDYWVAHFRRHGFEPVDAIRPRIWHDERVDFFYAQNMLVFARPEVVEHSPALRAAREKTDFERLSIVHPRQFENTKYVVDTYYVRGDSPHLMIAALPRAVKRYIGQLVRARQR